MHKAFLIYRNPDFLWFNNDMPYLYSAFSKLSYGISVTCAFLRFSVDSLKSEIHKFHAETGSVDAERHELGRWPGNQNVTTTCTYKYVTRQLSKDYDSFLFTCLEN